jgi:glycosyltransferase involved in cell wall biosynthesis
MLARRERARVIHGNGTRENIAAGLAGRLLGIPAVWHLRNLVAPGMHDLEKPLSFLPAAILANSRAVARRMKRLRCARRKLRVVYNGVDAGLFEGNGTAPLRRELGASGDEVLVGLVGRMGPGKGHEMFLEAARLIAKEHGEVKFAVIGGELFAEEGREQRIERLICGYGLSGRVACTGHRSDVERCIRALDILVLASEREPFGRVLIEAMAAGKAIVATDAGGVQEVVEGGVTALLVPPRDSAAMASAIVRLSRDRSLRERMGHAGRERVRERFSIEEHVTKIEEIYSEILNGKRKQRRGPSLQGRRSQQRHA